jgi:hypothetical protein
MGYYRCSAINALRDTFYPLQNNFSYPLMVVLSPHHREKENGILLSRKCLEVHFR